MAWAAVPIDRNSPTKSPAKKRRDTKPTPEFCRSAGGHGNKKPIRKKTPPDVEVEFVDSDSSTSLEDERKPAALPNKVRFSNGSSAADAIAVDSSSSDSSDDDKKPAAVKKKNHQVAGARKSTPFQPQMKPPPAASFPFPDRDSDTESQSDSSTESSDEESYQKPSTKRVQRKRRTTKRGKKATGKCTKKDMKKNKKKKDDTPAKWKNRKARAKERHEERKEERKKKKAEQPDDVEDPITPPHSSVKPKYWRSSAQWEHDARLSNWKSAASTYSRMSGFPGAKAIQTVLETTSDQNGKSQLRGYRVPSPTLAPADKASRDAIVKAATTVILKLAKASIIRMFRDDPSLIYYFVDVSSAATRNTDRPPSPVHNAIAATMGAIMDMFDPAEENKEGGKENKGGKGGKKK
eukprot:Sro228_g092740.1 n/a (407) ;mRNA; r:59495-60715